MESTTMQRCLPWCATVGKMERLTMPHGGENVEKLLHTFTAGGDVKCYSKCGDQLFTFLKLSILSLLNSKRNVSREHVRKKKF